MNETQQMTALSSQDNSNLWSAAQKAIARSRLWEFILIAIGSASSIIYPLL